MLPHAEQHPVLGDDGLRPSFFCALENAIVRLVRRNCKLLLRLDELTDFESAVMKRAQFIWIPVELFAQNVNRLLKNGGGDSDFDLVLDSAMDQLEGFSPEVECADVLVGI